MNERKKQLCITVESKSNETPPKKKRGDERYDGRMDGRKNGLTGGRADGRTGGLIFDQLGAIINFLLKQETAEIK